MANKFKSVKCKSGLTGWQGKLQDVYSSFDEFEKYDDIYNFEWTSYFYSRNFGCLEDIWNENPTLRGSVIPSDLELVSK